MKWSGRLVSALYYLHDDMLGTPQIATDSNQAVQWQASYDPLGSASLSGTITQNLRLPGQYFDLESGWNHNGFRDYVPQLGRYIEPDPLGRLGSGNNLYICAGDDPTDLDDPLGLQAQPTPAPGPILVPPQGPVLVPPVNPGPILGIPWEAPVGFFFFLFNSQPLNMDEIKWQAQQKDAEYKAYKAACNYQYLSPSMDPCARLSRQINDTQRCIALRQAWDDKWSPGEHAQEIQNQLNRLDGLKNQHQNEFRKY